MIPTDAQIEAAARAIFDNMTDIDGDEADWLYFREMLETGAKAALTAAAEVGEWKSTARNNAMQVLAERNAELSERLNATIERCAQGAHDWLKHHGYEVEAVECAAAIRALKNKP